MVVTVVWNAGQGRMFTVYVVSVVLVVAGLQSWRRAGCVIVVGFMMEAWLDLIIVNEICLVAWLVVSEKWMSWKVLGFAISLSSLLTKTTMVTTRVRGRI